MIIRYFFLKNTLIGEPLRLNLSRSLFSKKRLYGLFTYCGKLQKKANEGVTVGNWVIYLILMYLPFIAGGG